MPSSAKKSKDKKGKVVTVVHRSNANQLPIRKQERCINKFCKQVCCLFRRKSKVAQRERSYPNRDLCESRNTSSRQGSGDPLKLDRDSSAIASILKEWRERDGEASNTDTADDGEVIIYIPRVSRSKLQKKYLDPLQQANYNPVIIRPGDVKLKVGDKNNNSITDSTSELVKARPSTTTTTDHNNNILPFSEAGGSKTVLFYIPSTTSSGLGHPQLQSLNGKFRHSFRLHERIVNCHAIEHKHATAKSNRERLLQERVVKLQSYFEIWRRRKHVGEKKKKLAKDQQSAVCSPPNMLESRFHHIHWLGKGPDQHNSVGRYFDKEENSVVAVKIFSDKPFETMLENLDNKLMAIQEIHALNHMNHRNVVKLLGYFELHDKYHLILESCDHCLRQEINEAPKGLGTSASKKIIKYILSGLNFCHQAKCIHRDLSPENILVCRNGLVKIADFDRSAFISEIGTGSISPTLGNYVYNSPEILAGDKEYGLPSDVWSLGIIFCELLTGKPPWNGKSPQSQLREIHNCVGPLLPRHASVAKLQVDEKSYTGTGVHNHAQLQQMFTTISAPCCSFIMKCLDVNPLCRFTCGELLQHQFMKGHYK